MKDFIVNNYLLIVIIGAFLIFALIGFAVDTTKNRKNKESEILTEPNEDVNIEIANDLVEEKTEEVKEEAVESAIPEAEEVNLNMDNK